MAMIAAIVVPSYAQTKQGTLIIYRPRGMSVGLVHYAQGEHPTIVCDGTNIAKLAEKRKTTVSAVIGTHICASNEKQYPGTLDATSDKLSISVKQDGVTYLRLESHFGHVRFVLREVSAEVGAAEVEKMRPVKDKDSYTTVLAMNGG